MCGLFDTCPPTHAQILEAMQFTGRLNPPPIVMMVDPSDLSPPSYAGAHSKAEPDGEYDEWPNAILLTWNWSMTVLVHEMRHAYQKQEHKELDECDAYSYGIKYALKHNQYRDARWQKQQYYALHCKGTP